jgi:uncharacterized protein (TIGR00255 family)
MGSHFSRGNIQASLTVTSAENRVEAQINQAALDAVLALRSQLAGIIDPAPLKLDTLLGIRGIIDFKDAGDEPGALEVLDRDLMSALESASAGMRRMREAEGAALAIVLNSQVDAIERLSGLIEGDPSRSPEMIRARLETLIAAILEAPGNLDRDRLHGEVALLATKADIREELDRLKAHTSAARDLLRVGGPVGRKLDFLAQEFNRESNTICSKSNSAAVTAAGIELKVVIDQFREQVQNLE